MLLLKYPIMMLLKSRRFASSLLLSLATVFVFSDSTVRLSPGRAAGQVRITSDTPGAQQPRRNVGMFFEKLRMGRAVTVAFIGGSNMAGVGLGAPEKNAYPALVGEWLRKTWPQARLTMLDAGVAHTGSLYATLRARRDVIADKPDLVFVDLSTSDAGEEETVVKKATEGLLRQLLIVPQPPEVVMLYAASANPESRTEGYDVIAAHYQVPSLNLQTKTAAAIESGRLKAADVWKSGGHASEAGHRFFAEQIGAFLSEQQGLKPSPIARSLPGPLISDELNYGEFRTFAEVPAGAGQESNWKAEGISDRAFPTELLVGNKPGAQLEVYFEGTVVGLSFRTGPDAGTIECLIDGKPAPAPLAKVDCFDNSTHVGARIIAGGLGLGEHKLTIRILPEKNARSSGNHIRLGYLLFGGQRPEKL
jgi:lysophospholipase L1-like esterase